MDNGSIPTEAQSNADLLGWEISKRHEREAEDLRRVQGNQRGEDLCRAAKSVILNPSPENIEKLKRYVDRYQNRP